MLQTKTHYLAKCLPAPGNPGFDIISLETTPKNESLTIFVECTVAISPEMVECKRRITLRESRLESDKAILVVCAFDKLHPDWLKEVDKNMKDKMADETSDDYTYENEYEKERKENTPQIVEDDGWNGMCYSNSWEYVKRKPPHNTLVLDQTALRDTYTESLISLPQFILMGMFSPFFSLLSSYIIQMQI